MAVVSSRTHFLRSQGLVTPIKVKWGSQIGVSQGGTAVTWTLGPSTGMRKARSSNKVGGWRRRPVRVNGNRVTIGAGSEG